MPLSALWYTGDTVMSTRKAKAPNKLKLFKNYKFMSGLSFRCFILFSKVWGITSSKGYNLQLGATVSGEYRENRALPFSFVFDFQEKDISSPCEMYKAKRNRKVEWTLVREDGSPRYSNRIWKSLELFQVSSSPQIWGLLS